MHAVMFGTVRFGHYLFQKLPAVAAWTRVKYAVVFYCESIAECYLR